MVRHFPLTASLLRHQCSNTNADHALEQLNIDIICAGPPLSLKPTGLHKAISTVSTPPLPNQPAVRSMPTSRWIAMR